jgi:hypothetical protein
MGTPTLDIHPRVIERADTTRYEFDLAYSNAPTRTVFYEVPADVAPRVDNFDGILCAVVLHAMQEHRDVRLRGPATRAALLNLGEFQLVWAGWRPAQYRPVSLEADTIVPPTARASRSLAAFSGGVDSTFSVLRNNPQAAPPRYPVDTVLLVHGFDVALGLGDALDELIARTAPVRDLTGTRLVVVRTNSKELGLQKWQDSCGAQLAGCLHLFSGAFTHALIASSDAYDELWLPWGTNPLTDHLLSGAQLEIVHDGAAFSRTDKLAFLAGVPAALRTLKVCWEGKDRARNCGVCEKCVRTQINLMAVGVVAPPCFDRPLDPRVIRRLPIKSDLVLAELRSIVEYGERHQLTAAWFHELRRRVRRGLGSGRPKWMPQVRGARLARAPLVSAARRVCSKLMLLGSG